MTKFLAHGVAAKVEMAAIFLGFIAGILVFVFNGYSWDVWEVIELGGVFSLMLMILGLGERYIRTSPKSCSVLSLAMYSPALCALGFLEAVGLLVR